MPRLKMTDNEKRIRAELRAELRRGKYGWNVNAARVAFLRNLLDVEKLNRSEPDRRFK